MNAQQRASMRLGRERPRKAPWLSDTVRALIEASMRLGRERPRKDGVEVLPVAPNS